MPGTVLLAAPSGAALPSPSFGNQLQFSVHRTPQQRISISKGAVSSSHHRCTFVPVQIIMTVDMLHGGIAHVAVSAEQGLYLLDLVK